MKEMWKFYYMQYKDKELDERCYSININGKVTDQQLQVINKIVDEQLSEIENPSLWNINLRQYVAAITILDYNGKLRETKKRPPEKPGWLIQGEPRSRLSESIYHI